MNQQPDKFFRDKLYGYERPVSPQAWNRISANRKGGSRIKWMAIAATLLLLAVAGILILRPVSEKPPMAVIEKSPAEENNVPSQSDTKSSPNQQPVVTEEPKQERVALSDQTKENTALKRVDKQNIVREKSQENSHNAVVAIEPPPPLFEIELEAVTEKVANNDAKITHSLQDERKTVKIVFTAEEVNNKYLNKSAVAEATSPAKETSTIQKLLDKAYDLKHNQDPLGELRQKKNEILALNFGGERQRTDN